MTQLTVSIVKALKEVVVLRIGFNPIRTTSPCYKPTHQCFFRRRQRKRKFSLTKLN